MSVSSSLAARHRFRFSPNPNRAHLVRWYEWGPEAFAVAREQNKPVMLFLGAFWCGYCQRMDETALSHDEIIALLNAYYIPVRVEEAQRPDIDVRYNQNGWPTIVFLTAAGGYLASVNYLPAEDFGDVLVRIHVAHARQKEVREALTGEEPGASQNDDDVAKPPEVRWPALDEISELLMDGADRVHGGYGVDRKFPHCEVTNLFLDRYESTGDRRFLEHATFTLDQMMKSKLHDGEGGFFRYSSRRDWSEPHFEKLLADQAGLLTNYLRAFAITRSAAYRAVSEEIIDYMNAGLSDAKRSATYYGSRDYIRLAPGKTPPPGAVLHDQKQMFSIVDDCMYVDANARASLALLQAAHELDRPDCRERALRGLEFLWERCFLEGVGMHHYFDGEPRVPGLVMDQVCMGSALVEAFDLTGAPSYRERAGLLAEVIVRHFTNPSGGYYDTSERGLALLGKPLTLLTDNGAAACFFAGLWRATGENEHLEAATWALRSFTGDFGKYGVHAAEYGRALSYLVKVGKEAD